MTDQFRLVYAGEINDGQHAAVVKKRLGAVLKLDGERMDVLFSGRSVVVKQAADKATAARYQTAFDKAGARLRVLPLQDAAPASSESRQAASPASPVSAEGGMQMLPVGSELLSEDERAAPVEVDVNTSHLAVQGAVFVTHEPREEIAGPNVDHLTMAEAGAQIGESAGDVVVRDIDTDFDLAEVGAFMVDESEAVPAALDIEKVDFDVAELGAEMDTKEKQPPPPAPDISHMQLDEEES